MMATTVIMFLASLLISGLVLVVVLALESLRQKRTRPQPTQTQPTGYTGFWQQRQERKRR